MNDHDKQQQVKPPPVSTIVINPVGGTILANDDPAVPGSGMGPAARNISDPATTVGGGRIGSIPIPKAPPQQLIMGTSNPSFSHHHNPLQAVVPFLAPHPQLFQTTSAACNTTSVNFPNHQSHLPDERKRLLRSGKWVPEEEVYAALLIEAFEAGVANDCANGSTLRSYLATKLQCAPMRISKKFAGKGIGKMVYLSQQNQHHHHHASGAQPDPELEQKLRQAEQRFHQAILPMAATFLSQLPFAHQGLMVPNLPVPLQGLMMPHISLLLPPVEVPAAAAAAAALPSAPQDAAAEHAKQLKESYLRALQQMPPPPTQLGVAPPAAAEMPQHSHGRTTIASAASMSSHGITTQQSSLVQIPEAPNFLLGFDQNMLLQSILKPQLDPATTIAACISSEQQLETSGTEEVFVTSRSFDDFHRLLGKDVTILGNNGSGQLPEGTKNCQNQGHSNDSNNNGNALFTAESYALLAQESAQEASKHAAYHRTPELMLSTLPIANAYNLDIDGMLKQIMSTAFAPTNAENDEEDAQRPQGESSQHAQQRPGQGDDRAVNRNGGDHRNMNGLVLSSKRKPHPTVTMQPELTPVERFVGVATNMVSSGSEPSGGSASSASDGAGFREGAGSDDNHTAASLDNNTFNDSEDDLSTSCSGSDSDSDRGGPQRKKTKLDHCSSGSSIDSIVEEIGEHPQMQQGHQQLQHHHHNYHHHDDDEP